MLREFSYLLVYLIYSNSSLSLTYVGAETFGFKSPIPPTIELFKKNKNLFIKHVGESCVH